MTLRPTVAWLHCFGKCSVFLLVRVSLIKDSSPQYCFSNFTSAASAKGNHSPTLLNVQWYSFYNLLQFKFPAHSLSFIKLFLFPTQMLSFMTTQQMKNKCFRSPAYSFPLSDFISVPQLFSTSLSPRQNIITTSKGVLTSKILHIQIFKVFAEIQLPHQKA